MALTNKLSAIGNAIREKTGKTGKLTLEQMATEILSIQTGSSGEEENAFSMRLLAQDEVTYDNFTATTATNVKIIKGFTYPFIDQETASFIVCLMVRRGGFVDGEPAYAVGFLANTLTATAGPSFEEACAYPKGDGTFATTTRGYGAFPRTLHTANGLIIGGRCYTAMPSINGTYDVYLYEIKAS